MRRVSKLLSLAVLLCSAHAHAAETFIALAYHDVQDNPATERIADAETVSTADLVAQFSWMREHGYHPIGIDDVLAARAGRRALPDKAVLLTFDDGYLSTYTRVFPLLKLFRYPAVVAPMVSWLERPPGSQVRYGSQLVPRNDFLTWPQINEMQDSGLVEIASHSYDLHHGIEGNPQGNLEPAATTLAYDTRRGRYETDRHHLQRVRDDLARSVRTIARRTGRKPRVMVWPYGRYSAALVETARKLGMPVTLTLDDGINTPADAAAIRRVLIDDQAQLGRLVTILRGGEAPEPVRVAHVDLDYVYDKDPEQQEKNLGKLLDRIEALQINTVYLQAFADPDGNGEADALYFPNRHLPMRADLFNRVAWQLETRTGVRVYAWMPVLAFKLDPSQELARHVVLRETPTGAEVDPTRYPRLTPFDTDVRRMVGDLYEDLARHAYFDGVLFHDDATLAEDEDGSADALALYRSAWRLPASVAEIRASPDVTARWTQLKTEWLIDFTEYLANRVRPYRPGIKTARNLYAEVVLEPQAQAWFAQSLDAFVAHYDYVALMAMPYMEGADDPQSWLAGLAVKVGERAGALDKTVFELQSVDWRHRRLVDADELSAQMRLIERLGARHFGYYPDDFILGHPEIKKMRAAISLNTDPYRDPYRD